MHIIRALAPAEASAIAAAAARSAAWHPACINVGLDVDPAVRDAEVLFEADEPALIALCRDRLFTATRDIAVRDAYGTVLAEIQIVRYHPGGHYAQHRDSPQRGATPRALSLVCYLNDDFRGGATTFTEPVVVVSPLAGAAVVFAPELLHQAQPVESGTKYVITAWYHVPPAPQKEQHP